MLGRVISHLEEGIISLLLVTMTVLVFVEVVLRFGFNTGFLWSDELTLHLSAWMVLFGASYGVKVGSHIGVDAVVRILSTKARRVVTLIAVAICIAYCVMIIDGAWVYLAKVYSIGIELDDLPIPKYVAHSILLFGYILLAFRFLELGWMVFTGKADGFRSADEAEEALKQLEKERAEQAGGEARS